MGITFRRFLFCRIDKSHGRWLHTFCKVRFDAVSTSGKAHRFGWSSCRPPNGTDGSARAREASRSDGSIFLYFLNFVHILRLFFSKGKKEFFMKYKSIAVFSGASKNIISLYQAPMRRVGELLAEHKITMVFGIGDDGL